MKNSRADVLESLLAAEQPIWKIRDLLAQYKWDTSKALVTLRKDHATRVLQRFVLEQLSASEVYLWASTIEHRDDIEIEEASRDVLNELIFELATPEVNRPLTKELARDYIRRLSQSQHEPSGSNSA